jgi:hypothetical protein
MRECRELPSRDILLEIFENISHETFGENVPQRFNCVDFVQLDISLENLLTKPNCLDCVILALRSNLANTSAPELSSWMETFMVLFPIGRLVASANKRTMSMMGNSSLQHAEKAMILASIMDRAVSVCYFDCQNNGHSAKVMMNPVWLLVQAGSV